MESTRENLNYMQLRVDEYRKMIKAKMVGSDYSLVAFDYRKSGEPGLYGTISCTLKGKKRPISIFYSYKAHPDHNSFIDSFNLDAIVLDYIKRDSTLRLAGCDFPTKSISFFENENCEGKKHTLPKEDFEQIYKNGKFSRNKYEELVNGHIDMINQMRSSGTRGDTDKPSLHQQAPINLIKKSDASEVAVSPYSLNELRENSSAEAQPLSPSGVSQNSMFPLPLSGNTSGSADTGKTPTSDGDKKLR